MSHFSADEWVDFTRGLLPPAKAAAMQAILDQGCSECRSSLQLWRAVLESSPSERRYQPSETAVQSVKDAYVSEKPWKWIISSAQFAQVLFDSMKEPALAGVRSSTKASRQMTVKAEPFVIDLQLDSDSVRGRVSLTGQILNSQNSQTVINGADVVLLDAEKLIQKTKANELGEFYLDFSHQENLRLFINIRSERAIGIILPSMDSNGSDA